MSRNKKIFFLILSLLVITLLFCIVPESNNKLNTPHFSFNYSSSIDKEKIVSISKSLEANYERIQKDLMTKAAPRVEIFVYTNRWQYIKATGNWGASGSIEGINKIHFMEQAWDETDPTKVCIHEFSHTVTLKMLLDNEKQPVNSEDFDNKFSTFPIWLWEAISVYEADEFINPKTLAYLKNGKEPSLEELNDRNKGGKIYSCGYTIIEYILQKYGKEKLIALLKNYGDLQLSLGCSNEQFLGDWYQFVKNKYLK